ncbi:helix-turn-helix domain-containing protein [Avibacterium sp. 21-586]|uniref:helix-turn-helix domain-containing protein n=1 Tax=Avibacterium sp. 21-586 TaxID=2911534 RepID=UPI00224573F8|nr:helix-turn-helix transcriptional regulator [Avibacterium sp. 21-586]MCW9711258.1 helix-turn-helix domain-containing protein [Avibacterium sp. 21-586]
MKPKDIVRQKIRDIREDKKITQAAMAELLHMSEGGYAKIERGETEIKIDRLANIAQILGVEMVDLIPFGESTIIFNNSNDNFSNSSNFNLALGEPASQSEIIRLNDVIQAKNEILDSRDREIESLKQQIATLEKLIVALETNSN